MIDKGPPESPAGSNTSKELKLPFLVDDYFVPNGCFGDADCARGVLTIDSHGCEDPPASVQSVCRVFTYTPLPEGDPDKKGYLGILFQDVGEGGESTIGRVPGLPVQPGAKRVVFWAKLRSGNVQVGFRTGGANNWHEIDKSLPYWDTFGIEKMVDLGNTYQKIAIDLSDTSYTDVVSPFGWSISSEEQTLPESMALYIADLRWE
jgi:hypothetical protein